MDTVGVKTCGKAENDEAKSGNDEAKGVPGRRGVTEGDGRWRKVTERCDGGLMRKRSAEECEEDGKRGLLDNDGRGLNFTSLNLF